MRLFAPANGPRLLLGTVGTGLLPKRLTLSAGQVATHKHVMGTTGAGKSKLLASMVVQLMQQGIGVAVIDPTTDLTRDILRALHCVGFFRKPDATRRLHYLDFTNPTKHVPFNVLQKRNATPHDVAEYVNKVCLRVWPNLADGNAPRFENILLSAVHVLAAHNLSLISLQPLLTDKAYREHLLVGIDPFVVSFFHERFDVWESRDRTNNIESTLNKIFRLLYAPVMRYSLGQAANAIDFRHYMDSGTCVIFNLGGLEDEHRKFLGCLLMVGFESAALSRAELDEDERRAYHVFLDEFPDFTATNEKDLAGALSMARKYNMHLTLANQTWSQVSTRLAGALQNTIGITMKLGHDDAVWAAPRIGRFIPGEVKQVGEAEKEYPLSVQETFTAWSDELEGLDTRQAYVTIGKTSQKVRTPYLETRGCSKAQLKAIMESYTSLLVDQASIKPSIDIPVKVEVAAAPRLVAVE